MSASVKYKPARCSFLEQFEAANKALGVLTRQVAALEMTSLLPQQRRNLAWPDFNHRAKAYFRIRVLQRREARRCGRS